MAACQKCGQTHQPRKCTGHRKRHAAGEELQPCGAWAVRGRTVCRMHGAHSLRGPGHPRFESGRFSKALPAGWRENSERLARDAGLLELRDHIALVDTMLYSELETVRDTNPEVSVAAARRAMRSLDSATARRDGAAAQAAYGELRKAIDDVAAGQHAHRKILDLLEQRRRLVDTEHRRVERMKAYVTAEQLDALAYRYVDLVQVLADKITGGILERLGAGQLTPDDVRQIGRQGVSDFAAELQAIAEAEGASDVDVDEGSAPN